MSVWKPSIIQTRKWFRHRGAESFYLPATRFLFWLRLRICTLSYHWPLGYFNLFPSFIWPVVRIPPIWKTICRKMFFTPLPHMTVSVWHRWSVTPFHLHIRYSSFVPSQIYSVNSVSYGWHAYRKPILLEIVPHEVKHTLKHRSISGENHNQNFKWTQPGLQVSWLCLHACLCLKKIKSRIYMYIYISISRNTLCCCICLMLLGKYVSEDFDTYTPIIGMYSIEYYIPNSHMRRVWYITNRIVEYIWVMWSPTKC